MSVSFSVVFESEVPPHGSLGADHVALARHKEALDQLAEENGLVPLSAFESYDPEDAAEFLDEEELAVLPDAQWFEPSEGLTAVRALIDFLRSHVDSVPDPDEVLADMSSVEGECADAEKAGVRFRFAIVA
jgi:hypothetical protein